MGGGNLAGGRGALGQAGIGGGQVATLPGGARVSADVATNSLIVYAPASVQPLYEKLIQSLDQRRPQVMIEAEIVAVDTSDNFSAGRGGFDWRSHRDQSVVQIHLIRAQRSRSGTGALLVNPSLGFNGVLVDPDVADVIVQALSTHTRSRVLASPKILVNDNQTGTLESVASVPFDSVNTHQSDRHPEFGGRPTSRYNHYSHTPHQRGRSPSIRIRGGVQHVCRPG